MSVDNEAIGFLILWGLVIVAAVFVVRLLGEGTFVPVVGTRPGQRCFTG